MATPIMTRIGTFLGAIVTLILGTASLAAATSLDLSCTTTPVQGSEGADLGGRYQFNATVTNASNPSIQSVVLVLDRKGNILEEISVVDGQVFQLALRDKTIVKQQSGKVSWMIHAPGILFRSIVRDGYNRAVAFCSPFAALRVDQPREAVFVANVNSPSAPVHLVAGISRMDPASIQMEVDCTDILQAIGATLPGGPFSGTVDIGGATVTVEDLSMDIDRGTLAVTLLGLPGGEHKVHLTGIPEYLNALPPGSAHWRRPLGTLENSRTVNVFRAEINSPSNGASLSDGAVMIHGTVTHGFPIGNIRIHGKAPDSRIDSHVGGDSCTGGRYTTVFETEIPRADLEQDFVRGDGVVSAVDPGTNYVSLLAADFSGNVAGDRTRVIIGPTNVAPTRSLDPAAREFLPSCTPREAPNAYVRNGLAASVSDRALTEVLRARALPYLKEKAAAGLDTLRGRTLPHEFTVDPCHGPPLESTSHSLETSYHHQSRSPNILPMGPGGPPLQVVGDRSVVKTKPLQLDLRSEITPGCSSADLHFGVLNAPSNSQLIQDDTQPRASFGWVPTCEQVGSYSMTFFVEDCHGRTEQNVVVRSEDGDTKVDLTFDFTFERVEYDLDQMDVAARILPGPSSHPVEVDFTASQLAFKINAHRCLAHFIGCWLSVNVPIYVDVNDFRMVSNLTAQQALCGFAGEEPSIRVDPTRTDIDLFFGVPEFGGLLGWLVDFVTAPLRLFFSYLANIRVLFLDEFFESRLETGLNLLLTQIYPDGSLFSIKDLSFGTTLSDDVPLSFSILPSYNPKVVPSTADHFGSVGLGLHSQFLAGVDPDPATNWVPTPSAYTSASAEDRDIVLQLSDDAVNQLLASLAMTGVMRTRFGPYTIGDFVATISPELIQHLDVFGLALEDELDLSLDLAQDPEGHDIPPFVAFVDDKSTDGLELMIRVQADVRGFVPKDRTVVDDRNLCSCIDPRPECFTQPCLLFEEVLKLNILMECAIDSTSEMSSPVLDFHVLDVQQLAREEGFSSYEAIDLSSDESTIVHSAADSPLLSALLDILNRKIPSLTIPSEAVTLDKSVTPIRQMLFASRVDGSGHGIQDYIGLAEDVELTTAAKAPRKSARRIDVVGKESGVINDDTRDSEAASEMIDSRDIILHQNHPNPFNPATTVEYELGEAGHVQLSVYDLSGRRVTTLVNQTQSRGHHSIVWNGTSSSGATVSSGIYFCRLRTARRTETRRMVLLR